MWGLAIRSHPCDGDPGGFDDDDGEPRLTNNNVIRLLAYSSIAHMGYLLLGLVAGSPAGISSVYLYSWVYLFTNLGAFAVVICLSNGLQSSDLSAYEGSLNVPPCSTRFWFSLFDELGRPASDRRLHREVLCVLFRVQCRMDMAGHHRGSQQRHCRGVLPKFCARCISRRRHLRKLFQLIWRQDLF